MSVAQRGALYQTLPGESGEPGALCWRDVFFHLTARMGGKGIRDKLRLEGIVFAPDAPFNPRRVA